MRLSAMLGVVVLTVSACSSAGAVQAVQDSSAVPVQDVTLNGSSLLHLSVATGARGVSDAAPTALGPRDAVTGCWEWTDAERVPHWAARVAGAADGHAVVLAFGVDAQSTAPLGTHPTAGAVSPSGWSSLAVDGVWYPGVHVDPSDAMPSYFTLDHDGTTGLISVRFAASSGGPQAFYVVGRWRCA